MALHCSRELMQMEPKDQGDIEWDAERLIPDKQLTKQCDSNEQAKLMEESAKRALGLKKNELKWKLMQISHAQNSAKLKEIQTAVCYHRRKLSKAQELAARLREKYIKVVKSAKLTELQYKKAEAELSQQERFVAEEKMQLTKLALDCLSTGKDLFGDSYRLPENSGQQQQHPGRSVEGVAASRPTIKPANGTSGGNGAIGLPSKAPVDAEILQNLSPFLRKARQTANHQFSAPSQAMGEQRTGAKSGERRKRVKTSRLSSIYDLNDSIFRKLASYRLTNLLGTCSDRMCKYQHKSNYQMTDLERLTDLLSYRPQVAGFKPDPDLSVEDNFRLCRIKLKQYAAKLIARNSDKSVEVIAKHLVKKIRANQSDIELILKQRELPKAAHLRAPPLTSCACQPILVEQKAGEDSPASSLPLDEIKIKLEPIDLD